jgi:glycosyltransferase involved in cell wall biosynthesis
MFSWESIGVWKEKFIIRDQPQDWNTCVWNCIYKKDLIGITRFNETKQIAEDEDFNNRVRKGKRANIDKILYIYNSEREDSLTRQFAKGLITKEVSNKIKTQVLFYQKAVGPIGGIETSIYERLKALKDKYDILFVYKDGDPKQLNRYRQLVRCMRFTGQQFECNKYISCSAYDNIADNVISLDNFYAQEIHADYKAMGWKYKKHPKTNIHIAVSEIARKSFLELNPNETCEVVYNLLNIEPTMEVLRLVSATRLSKEKGYERMKMFAKELNKKGIPFEWTVFTTDLCNEDIDGFVFRKARFDVRNFIADADYLVQLSDTESWCYTLAEALELGTPVITTDMPVLKELGVIDKENGFVLPFDMSNMRVEEIYNAHLKGFKYTKRDNPKQIMKLLGDMRKQDNYIFEEQKEWLVRPLLHYFDNVEQKQMTRGIEFTVKTKERLNILLGNNPNERVYVEIVE